MIIVTGATGHLGRAIVQELVQRLSPKQIGASARTPEKANDLAALGVRVRAADFAEPDGLAHAFEGATQVLVVSSNARAYGGDPLAQHRAAIEAARSAGARRIVYTSHMAASRNSEFSPMHDHAETEEMLRQSGLAWTALRHGFYASASVIMMGDAFQTGTLVTPADGKVAWTAHSDLAAAAATILVDEGRFDGPTPPLTGPEALDFGDLAGVASELLGRTVRHEVVADDEFRTKMAARGAPPRAAEHAIGFYRASRAGEFATVDPTLERLLGRRPTRVRDVLARKVET